MDSTQWLRGTQLADAIRALRSCPPTAWLLYAHFLGEDRASGAGGALAELLAARNAMLVVLDPSLTVLGCDVLRETVSEALAYPTRLTRLMPPGEPPPLTGVNQGLVHSFVGPASLLRAAPIRLAELTRETLCYWRCGR